MQYLTEEEFHQMAAEFLRVLRPGGLLAIKEFDVTPFQLGPLEPELIWRWLAARRQYEQVLGAQHALCFRKWLSEVGFTVGTHKTYVGEDQHPLTEYQLAFHRGGLRFFLVLQSNCLTFPKRRKRFGGIESPISIVRSILFMKRISIYAGHTR